MRRPTIDPNICAPPVRQAIQALRERGVTFDLKTVHQLKVDDLSFYPGRGTIFRDGDSGAIAEHGLEAFLTLVGGSAVARPKATQDSEPWNFDFA